MPKLIMLDFHCTDCGATFEELVDREARKATCECGVEATQSVTAKTGFLNDSGSQRVADTLRKRSFDHSVKMHRDNPEALASRIGGTPAVQQKWNVHSGTAVKKKSSTGD